MSETIFNLDRDETTVVKKCKSLKELKLALKDLDLYTIKFKYFTGVSDPISGEYVGLFFLTSPIEGKEAECHEIPITTPGKALALFLYSQYDSPSMQLYDKSDSPALGGWELMGYRDGDAGFLRADRVLLGSKSKGN